jgi:hypothetical protein
MRSSRQIRFVAALIALFSMLFMQLAVASYACPGMRTGQGNPASAMSAGSTTQTMSGCAGMDMEQPGLCHAQDQAGNQSLDKPDLPQVHPFMAAGLMQALIYVDATYRSPPTAPRALVLTRTTAPPLSIRNCCFRI